jgi:hypothetical protein
MLMAQTAADYLPLKLGSTWRYQRFVVDAAQNPIASTKTNETDSLTGPRLINGVTSYMFRNYTNVLRDSTIVSMHGDTIAYFNGGFPKESIKLVADSLGLGFLPQAPGWYSYVKLNSISGKTDTLYRHDSVLTIDGTEFDLRLIITRKMFPAGVTTVPAGIFNTAIPFEIDLVLNWWVYTPLGKKAQPFLKLKNMIYVAPNNWVIKETLDSTYFPLTATDNDSIPHFKIPGYIRQLEKLTATSVTVDRNSQDTPTGFQLSHNFPNPFNGTTTLSLDLGKQSAVTVRIFDVLGREIEVMYKGVMTPGIHRVKWSSGTRPSGIYFYEVETESSRAVRRMLLQK